ncbi:MAG: hypothetical protein IPH11_19220 [Ignavibacteriales bacterium]|nr:hypothetical protein [Ignavibacteriales bacterium]
MNGLLNSENIFFTSAFAIQFISIAFLFIKDQHKALFAANTVLLIGLALGLISTLSSALFSSNEFSSHSIFYNFIRLMVWEHTSYSSFS